MSSCAVELPVISDSGMKLFTASQGGPIEAPVTPEVAASGKRVMIASLAPGVRPVRPSGERLKSYEELEELGRKTALEIVSGFPGEVLSAPIPSRSIPAAEKTGMMELEPYP